ncbi:unnamed protein product, partial [Phaeothamnion confervicola]
MRSLSSGAGSDCWSPAGARTDLDDGGGGGGLGGGRPSATAAEAVAAAGELPPTGVGSFDHFTSQLVRQYRRDLEARRRHQEALLELRLTAVRERRARQLAWLEQQRRALDRERRRQRLGGASAGSG